MKHIFYLFIILLVGCNHKTETNSNKYNYDVFRHNEENEIVWNDVTEIDTIICLETINESLIGGIVNIIFHDDKYYIQNRERGSVQGGTVFDKNGKFLFKIGKPGKGPGEILAFRDMCIDKVNNHILVLDYLKIHKFNAETGTYITTIKLNLPKYFNPTSISVTKDGYYLKRIPPTTIDECKSNKFSTLLYKNNKVISEMFEYPSNNLPSYNEFTENYDGSVVTGPYFGDNKIYSISLGKIKPIAAIDFGEMKIKQSILEKKEDYSSISKENGYIGIRNPLQTENMLYFYSTGPKGDQSTLFFGSKKTKELYYSILSGGKPMSLFADKDFFYCSFSANDFYYDNVINKSPFLTALKKIDLSIEDNPVIFRFKLNLNE